MGYPLREFIPDAFYHVMARGNNKNVIFKEDDDYRRFLRILRKTRKRYAFSLFHFVLMPNHVHILLRPEAADVPRGLQYLFSCYGRYFATKYGTIGHVWQGRYRSKSISSEKYLYACGRYIEENPVRAGLVHDYKSWPYSSVHSLIHVSETRSRHE